MLLKMLLLRFVISNYCIISCITVSVDEYDIIMGLMF